MVAPIVTKRQPVLILPAQPEDRRVQVVDVHGIINRERPGCRDRHSRKDGCHVVALIHMVAVTLAKPEHYFIPFDLPELKVGEPNPSG